MMSKMAWSCGMNYNPTKRILDMKMDAKRIKGRPRRSWLNRIREVVGDNVKEMWKGCFRESDARREREMLERVRERERERDGRKIER